MMHPLNGSVLLLKNLKNKDVATGCWLETAAVPRLLNGKPKGTDDLHLNAVSTPFACNRSCLEYLEEIWLLWQCNHQINVILLHPSKAQVVLIKGSKWLGKLGTIRLCK